MGIYQNSGQQGYPVTKWLSVGNVYAEHEFGLKADPTKKPIGMGFKHRTTTEDGSYKTCYLYDFTKKPKVGYSAAGILDNISIRESEINGAMVKQLSIMLKDDVLKEKTNIQIPLLTSLGKVNSIAFDLLSKISSLDKLGFLIITPTLKTDKWLVSPEGNRVYLNKVEEVTGKGNFSKWESYKEFAKHKAEERDNGVLYITSITEKIDEAYALLAEGNVFEAKKLGVNVNASFKTNVLPEERVTKIVDGEELTIDNTKKRKDKYFSIVDDVIAKAKSLINNNPPSPKQEKAPSNEQPKEEAQKQEAPKAQLASEQEQADDDLPF